MHHQKSFCSPPGQPVEAFSMPVPVSTRPGVNSLTSRHYSLCLQFEDPRGFWISASGCRFGFDFIRRFPAMRAAVTRGPACGDTSPAASVDFSADPHGNHGDSKTQMTVGGVL